MALPGRPLQDLPSPPSWLTQSSAGHRIFVLYDRTEALWHERILVGHVGGWSWVVLTPTLDMYEEDFSEALELVQGGLKDGAPRQLYGKKMFRFSKRGTSAYAEW